MTSDEGDQRIPWEIYVWPVWLNSVLFPDVMKAVWDAKAIGDVTKKILKIMPAPETETSALIQQAKDKSKILQKHKNKKQKS